HRLRLGVAAGHLTDLRRGAWPRPFHSEGLSSRHQDLVDAAAHAGPPSTSVVSPCAILISVPWLTVQAILCVTASTSPAADGRPLPLFFTPPNGRCTSAPMHGRFT